METVVPAPLVPPEVDLSDFAFMPLDVARFRDSGMAAEVDFDAGFCAVLLWCAAWHQSPAGSLPASDQALAKLAGFGRDVHGWLDMRSRGALRGFVLCDDGRLYHPVIAEKALEGWIERLQGRIRGGMGNAKRWKAAFDPTDLRKMLTRAEQAQRTLLALKPLTLAPPPGPSLPPPPPAAPPPPAPPASPSGDAAKKRSRRRPVGQEGYSRAFEEFWEAYPSHRRSKKLEAWQRWQADQLEEFSETIIRDVQDRQIKHWTWVKDNGKYIPGAQVYLNGRRWNDAFEPLRGGEGKRATLEHANADTADRWANDQ